jgi:hypothetical protein
MNSLNIRSVHGQQLNPGATEVYINCSKGNKPYSRPATIICGPISGLVLVDTGFSRNLGYSVTHLSSGLKINSYYILNLQIAELYYKTVLRFTHGLIDWSLPQHLITHRAQFEDANHLNGPFEVLYRLNCIFRDICHSISVEGFADEDLSCLAARLDEIFMGVCNSGPDDYYGCYLGSKLWMFR